jgi:hypothetical protein
MLLVVVVLVVFVAHTGVPLFAKKVALQLKVPKVDDESVVVALLQQMVLFPVVSPRAQGSWSQLWHN